MDDVIDHSGWCGSFWKMGSRIHRTGADWQRSYRFGAVMESVSALENGGLVIAG